MNTTNSKIAEQSKQKLADALLVVMRYYDYKLITVTQISQEARLSRKTFYRLFPDKETLLEHLFENIYTDCITQIKATDIHHYWDLVQLYFDFWETQKNILLLFKRSGLLPMLFDFAYQHSREVFEYVRSNEVAISFNRELPYLLAYALGGMHSMLLKWVEDGMSVPAAELIEKLKSGFKSPDI